MALYAKNAKELAALIGRRGSLKIEGGLMHVDVEVQDARFIWGKTQVQVNPIAGIGGAWVDEARVTYLDAKGGE